MDIDIRNGNIRISNDLVITSDYTFNQFKKTKYYNNQDGIRVIYLDEVYFIDNRKYMVMLFFRNGKIYLVSLMCVDIDFTPEDEPKRKDLHDKILQEYGIADGEGKFDWGKIESIYDGRDNCSDILIIYY